MREKIRAAIQGGHSSVLNGIDSDKATTNVEVLIKNEGELVVMWIEELVDTWDDPYQGVPQFAVNSLIKNLRERYEI